MDKVRADVKKYFNEHFMERAAYRPTLDGVSFSDLSVEGVGSIYTRCDHFKENGGVGRDRHM